MNRKNWVKRIYTDRTGDFSIKYVMWNVSRSKPNRSPQISFTHPRVEDDCCLEYDLLYPLEVMYNIVLCRIPRYYYTDLQ